MWIVVRRGYLPIVLGGDRVASSPGLLPIQALFGSKTFESDLGMRLVIAYTILLLCCSCFTLSGLVRI